MMMGISDNRKQLVANTIRLLLSLKRDSREWNGNNGIVMETNMTRRRRWEKKKKTRRIFFSFSLIEIWTNINIPQRTWCGKLKQWQLIIFPTRARKIEFSCAIIEAFLVERVRVLVCVCEICAASWKLDSGPSSHYSQTSELETSF